MVVTDLKNMPRFNANAPNGATSVAEGHVFVGKQDNGITTVLCHIHKAMLCVAITDEGGRLYRCPTCNVGGYVTPERPMTLWQDVAREIRTITKTKEIKKDMSEVTDFQEWAVEYSKERPKARSLGEVIIRLLGGFTDSDVDMFNKMHDRKRIAYTKDAYRTGREDEKKLHLHIVKLEDGVA